MATDMQWALTTAEAVRTLLVSAKGDMMRARRSDEMFVGVAGVRFTTDARRNTPEEKQLQEIQSLLSGGVVSIGERDPIPHLSLVAQVNGPTIVSLWVPKAVEAEAARPLRDAGFELDD